MPMNISRKPYLDDFVEDKNYFKLLFHPGRAVQARELTQLQTILQNQMQKMGSHIFKDGDRILGGDIDYQGTNGNIKSLLLQDNDYRGNPARVSSLRPGMLVRRQLDNRKYPEVLGRVTGVSQKVNVGPLADNVLLFKYIRGESPGFGANEILVLYNPDLRSDNVPQFSVTTKDSTGSIQSSVAELKVNSGLYYWKGKFIKTRPEVKTLDDLGTQPSVRIGYRVEERIITASEDPTLLDASAGSSNYAAPGADRYQVELRLTIKPLNDTAVAIDNFFEIGKIKNGCVVWLAKNTVYSDIKKMIARRTFEESGNYIVEPYSLSIQNKDTAENPRLIAKLTNGVAYVKGYRHQAIGTKIFEMDKARDTRTEERTVDNVYGDNFIYIFDGVVAGVEKANGLFAVGSSVVGDASHGEAVSLHTSPKHHLNDHGLITSDKWNSTLVGTARPTMMFYDDAATQRTNDGGITGDVYRLYLSDFRANSISSTVSVANKINCVNVVVSAATTSYGFIDQTHGITSSDRVSVTVSEDAAFSISNYEVDSVGSTEIVIASNLGIGVGEKVLTGDIILTRTTGNSVATRTAVLDTSKSAALNDAYNGAKITFNYDNAAIAETRTIVGYVGTSQNPNQLFSYQPGSEKAISAFESRPLATSGTSDVQYATVILDSPLSSPVTYNTPYRISFSIGDVRSVVRASNKTATDYTYPVELHDAWNVDFINGVRTPVDQVGTRTESNQGRIEGVCIYNDNNTEENLLFPAGRPIGQTHRVMTHGNLDTGLSSNSVVYYSHYARGTQSSGTTDFTIQGSTFFGEGPLTYPYNETQGAPATTFQPAAAVEIKNNFLVSNRTTGEIIVPTQIRINVDANKATTSVEVDSSATNGNELELLVPARAKYVTPAYKELVAANTTWTDTFASDFSLGHLFVADADVNRISGGKQSLMKPDAFKLRGVIENFNPDDVLQKDLTLAANNITTHFTFDTGQRDMFYDNGSLVLKSDAPSPPSGNLFIMFDYFKRMDGPKGSGASESTNASFFAVDSYQHTTDVTFTSVSGVFPFAAGDYVTSNNATGYVLDYANTTTGTSAKMQLVGVLGTIAATDVMTVPNKDTTGVVSTVVTADVIYGGTNDTSIPVYTNRVGKKFPLRNMIDFRPYVASNNRVSDTLADSFPIIPTVGEPSFAKNVVQGAASITTTHKISSYVPRLDKIFVDKNGQYSSIKGSSGFTPRPPLVSSIRLEEELSLFNVFIPAYTFNTTGIIKDANKNIRHTMKDISKLSNRVKNLEYYVSLNTLEKSASDMSIFDGDGNERFKNGILVDNFMTSAVIDATNPDLQSISGDGPGADALTYAIGGGTLRSGIQEFNDSSVAATSGGNNLTWHGPAGQSIATLNYTPQAFITQPNATGSESVNPYDIQSYLGTLQLYPTEDRWFDTNNVSYTVIITDISGGTGNETLTITPDPDDNFNEIFSINGFYDDVTSQVDRNMGSINGPYFEYTAREDFEGGNEISPLGNFLNEHDRNIQLTLENTFHRLSAGAINQIQLAIQAADASNGTLQNIEIIPYIRERDIVIHASGLKPAWRADLKFDGTPIERHFFPATKVHWSISENPADVFTSSIDGSYERVVFQSGGKTANAMILAVRDGDFNVGDYKCGYIVPMSDPATGKIDFDTYRDGFYSDNWSEADIKNTGLHGDSGIRTLTGTRSGAAVTLFNGAGHLYNGHYSGHFTKDVVSTLGTPGESTDLGRVRLSPDASRYIANNFGRVAGTNLSEYPDTTILNASEDIPAVCKLTIVGGTGQGQEGIIRSYDTTTRDADILWASTTTIVPDNTSIYSIGMRRTDMGRNPDLSQRASSFNLTNKYGEKFGILHIPRKGGVEFTYGRKLVEVTDRGDSGNWNITSYAAAYYESEGTAKSHLNNDVILEKLNRIIAPGSAYRVDGLTPEEQGYISAVGTGIGGVEISGKIAIATDVNVVNGGISTTYTAGESNFGTIGTNSGDMQGTGA
jgi:hypothetical protein